VELQSDLKFSTETTLGPPSPLVNTKGKNQSQSIINNKTLQILLYSASKAFFWQISLNITLFYATLFLKSHKKLVNSKHRI
jgi:hypothetical protein